jgi:hypothetical protein
MSLGTLSLECHLGKLSVSPTRANRIDETSGGHHLLALVGLKPLLLLELHYCELVVVTAHCKASFSLSRRYTLLSR